MFHNFWKISLVAKIVLLGILTFFVQRVKSAIDVVDATSISSNFKIVEILTYIIVLFDYSLFVSKFIAKKQEGRRGHISPQPNHHDISYVNLSLVLVLLAFVLQMKSAMALAQKNPVPITFLADNFRFTENITTVLLGFNVVTSGIILFVKKENDMFNSSARSHSKK